MCTDKHHRHSIFCILPPYLLHQVASQGTSPKMRQMALDIISIDNTFRNLRMSNRSNADLTISSPTTFSVAGDKQRSIATAHNQQTFPGTIVRSEGSPPSNDNAVNEAYDGLGDTYDFFWETFNRNSIDDEGLPLVGIVHFGQDYSAWFLEMEIWTCLIDSPRHLM
jgi:Zn-dependent metalloprotease